MKKLLLIILLSFTLLFLFSGTINAAPPYAPGCTADNNTTDPAAWNFTTNKSAGLVPCGISKYPDPLLAGSPAGASPGQLVCPCTLNHLFIMALRIYVFIALYIATPLASLLIVIGGLLILLSGLNNNWFSTGKNMILWSFVAIILIWSAWLIVEIVLKTIGYTGTWHVF